MWKPLYLDPDGGEEPASLLGDKVGVHATAVVMSAQEIVDVEPDGDWAEGIFATDVQDAAGGHLTAARDLTCRSDSVFPEGGSLLLQAWYDAVHSVFDVTTLAPDVLLKVDVIGCLTALEKYMGMEPQTRCCLPAEHEVRHDGGGVVIVIDVIRIIGSQSFRQVKGYEVRLEGMSPGEVPVGSQLRLSVTGHQLHAAGLVLAGVSVSEDVGHNEVFGMIIEAIDLKIQTLHPILSGKGEL